ncbi:hypothetical protein EBZ80_01235 [bacterium]|nr:hypothetical protein [bacterium]
MNRVQRIIEPFGLGSLEPEYGEEVFLTAPTEEEPLVVRRRAEPLLPSPPPAALQPERSHHNLTTSSRLHAVRLGGFYEVNPFFVFHKAAALTGLPLQSFYFSTLADGSQFCVLVFSDASEADKAYERLRYFPFHATVASVARLQ